jgi:hypothetical protein
MSLAFLDGAATIERMDVLVQILSRVLVVLFFAGMTGSVFVVIFTVIRDLRQIRTTHDEAGDSDL